MTPTVTSEEEPENLPAPPGTTPINLANQFTPTLV